MRDKSPESILTSVSLAAWSHGQLGASIADSYPPLLLALDTTLQGDISQGLIPLPVRPAFDLSSFHLTPN